VAVFAFLSVAVWVGTQFQDRKARDRFALLKTLAEQPGENAQRVLAMLREQEERQAARRESQERRTYLIGGLTSLAAGVGLSVMMAALSPKPGVWTVGLLVMLIGVVLTSFGVSTRLGGWSGDGPDRSDR
jgi:hypothetical protein